MKNVLKTSVSALVLMMFMNSCDILDLVDINFTTDAQSAEFVIEPAVSGTHCEEVEIILTDIKKQIEDNGGSIDNLKTVTISDLAISLVSGASNLDAFESFELKIKADDLDEKKIAWKDAVPTGVTSVDPEYTNDNLKDYIGKDSYTITLTGVLRSDVTADITLEVTAHYDVTL
jgi:hypothetical protein